jgi:hypothetical protein
MVRPACKLAGALILTFAGLCLGPAARADSSSEAGRLYDQATRALDRGDYAAAANDYARADELVPHADALEAALLAALETDEATLGMELAARAAREPDNERLSELATRASAKFSKRVGRIFVRCPACDEVIIDGTITKAGVASWVRPGAHDVVLRIGRERETRSVDVEVEGLVTVTPRATPAQAPPPVAPPPPPPAGDTHGPRRSERVETATGVSPAWFWIGLALTGGAAAGTIASGVDLGAKHADFVRKPTAESARRGETAQTRTRVLVGVTAGLAVVTTLVGALAVQWGDGDDAREVSLQAGWGQAHLRLRF